ncbi:MAG: CDP-alcohol phosphatidyltransferase family protein [bacterium]
MAVNMPDDPEVHKEDSTRRLLALSAPFERWFLPRAAARMPAWVTPDGLTAAGLVSSLGILGAYLLSTHHHPDWLWAASLCLVLHWFFDSTDGTLARVRGIERPNYGYYVDHMADVVTSLAILVGLGLTPYMRLSTALFILAGYLAMSVHTHVYANVRGEFKLGAGGVGPTEVRVILILFNTVCWLWPGLHIPLWVFGRAPIYEVFGWLVIVGFVVSLAVSVVASLDELGRLDPPQSPTPR